MDDKSSVECGFIYRMLPDEAARSDNLQLVPSSENRAEGAKGCK